MRTVFTLAFTLLLTVCHAQRVAKVYHHEITGEKVSESSTETWVKGGKNASAIYVLRRIGDAYELELKFIPLMTGAGALYTVQTTDSLIIITANGSRIGLPPGKPTNSCTGCGMFDTYGEFLHGTTTHHALMPEHIDVLLNEDVQTIGLQTSFAYVEQGIAKSKSESLRILLGYMAVY